MSEWFVPLSFRPKFLRFILICVFFYFLSPIFFLLFFSFSLGSNFFNLFLKLELFKLIFKS